MGSSLLGVLGSHARDVVHVLLLLQEGLWCRGGVCGMCCCFTGSLVCVTMFSPYGFEQVDETTSAVFSCWMETRWGVRGVNRGEKSVIPRVFVLYCVYVV